MVKTNDVFTLTKIGYALHFRPFGMVMVMMMMMIMMIMIMNQWIQWIPMEYRNYM
jgi:hypothetical protein